eukprot:764847_1
MAAKIGCNNGKKMINAYKNWSIKRDYGAEAQAKLDFENSWAKCYHCHKRMKVNQLDKHTDMIYGDCPEIVLQCGSCGAFDKRKNAKAHDDKCEKYQQWLKEQKK